MFDHLFENRNSTVTKLLKLGDCLGRSLRENVELFSIDSEDNRVAFLSESGKVITGTYDLDNQVSLSDVLVEDVDIFTNNNKFDAYVNEKVASFVGNLNTDSYGEADDRFTDILSLWENRLKFENVKKRLDEKQELFTESQNIINTSEFQRFLEVMPQFLTFLEEESEKIERVAEIENAIKLSNSISKAFNFPKLDLESLVENGQYQVQEGINKSIYEMICKRELVAKELLESKKGFEEVWATNPKIRHLASLVFDNDDVAILEGLVDAVVDVPYLALATKKQLFESIDNALGLTEYTNTSTKEIKTFVAKLFEAKKPLKKVITDILNEKYGINVLNLKDIPTFHSLANTQVVIFEALSRLSPKGSVLKEALSEVGTMLKTKNGVEVIDINDILQEAFDACEYPTFCEEYTLLEGLDFNNILNKEASPSDLLEMAKKRLLLDRDKEAAKRAKKAEKAEEVPHGGDDEDDSVQEEEVSPQEATVTEADAATEKEEKDAPPAEAEAAEPEAAPTKDSISDDDFMQALKDMDELMKDLTPEKEAELEKEAGEDEKEA